MSPATPAGCGVGGELLTHLLRTAPTYGYWKLVGMILADNPPGCGSPVRTDFARSAPTAAHATLGGRWRDVTLVERHLDLPGSRERLRPGTRSGVQRCENPLRTHPAAEDSMADDGSAGHRRRVP